MSISSELLTLNNTKTAIRTAINNKGGSVTSSTPFADYATAITNLPSGGSGNPILTSIDVSDFSGTTFNRVPSYITSVTLPNGLTTITDYAFYGCSGLTSFVIPNTVTSLGMSSFYGCSGLTSISVPSSITQIKNQTFYQCSGLTSVTLPNTITSIGNGAFYSCSSLTSIIINATTVPTIVANSNVFGSTNNCPIYVPSESVDAYKTSWVEYASRIQAIQQVATVDGNPVYNYDLGMTSTDTITSENMAKMPAGASVEFAEGLTNIAAGEINYQEVTLPSTFTGFGDSDMIGSNVTTITSNAVTPPSAFRNQLGGSGLTAIYVPASAVDTYKAHAAWGTFSSIIQAIPVPVMAEITQSDDSVYEIPYDGVGVLDENNVPFEDALAQATDIHITSYATAIGQPYELDGTYYGVFEGDGSTHTLKTVTIDEGITAIPNQAFASNDSLTTVTLPSTITSIGDYAFGMGVMSFTIHATTPPTLGTDAVGVKKQGRPPLGKFYVPASAVDTYKAATGWSTWAQYIEAIPSE